MYLNGNQWFRPALNSCEKKKKQNKTKHFNSIRTVNNNIVKLMFPYCDFQFCWNCFFFFLCCWARGWGGNPAVISGMFEPTRCYFSSVPCCVFWDAAQSQQGSGRMMGCISCPESYCFWKPFSQLHRSTPRSEVHSKVPFLMELGSISKGKSMWIIHCNVEEVRLILAPAMECSCIAPVGN